jgi:hypothetical protein
MTSPSLCQLLRTQSTPPAGQDGQAWATARAVLRGETAATAAATLPEPLFNALLDALVEERLAAPVEALSASPAKAVAKAARRAQYRLRSAGVATQRPAVPAQAPAPTEEPAPELPCLLSPPDGAGDSLLVVARPVKGGLALHEVVLSDEMGLLEHREFESSRSGYRRSLREARAQPLKEISLAEARALLAEAYRCNLATRSPLPRGAEDMLRRLDVAPAAAPPPPLPPPEEGDAVLALESASLHAEPELRGWLPPESELKLLAARVQEVQSSPLALADVQRAEQIQEKARAMAEAFFTPERSRLYARRLWALADVFDRTDRAQGAALARAEARRLFHGAPGLFSRFAEALYTKLLPKTPLPGAEAPGAPPAAPAASAPGERRSKGGLILP